MNRKQIRNYLTEKVQKYTKHKNILMILRVLVDFSPYFPSTPSKILFFFEEQLPCLFKYIFISTMSQRRMTQRLLKRSNFKDHKELINQILKIKNNYWSYGS